MQGATNVSVTANFQMFAQNAVGWSGASALSSSATISGIAPSSTSPSWWYHSGDFYGSCDFSWPGGDGNARPDVYGGTGQPPLAIDIEIDWQSKDITCASGATGCVKVVNQPAAPGNWAPCVSGQPQAVYGANNQPIWKYWTISLYPTYAAANWSIRFLPPSIPPSLSSPCSGSLPPTPSSLCLPTVQDGNNERRFRDQRSPAPTVRRESRRRSLHAEPLELRVRSFWGESRSL